MTSSQIVLQQSSAFSSYCCCVEYNVDINANTIFSLTVTLYFVLNAGETILLRNMPDSPQMISFVDGKGDTPYHTLLKMYPSLQGKLLASIVRLLLQKGVSPMIQDANHLIPIDYATQSKHKEVFDMLRKFCKRESSFHHCNASLYN
jgi:hypothetical protein